MSSRHSFSRCSRDFQVTILELGTIAAESKPLVIVTSNRTRDLPRRTLAALPVPLDRVPGAGPRGSDRGVGASPEVAEGLVRKVASAVQRMRRLDMAKKPGVADHRLGSCPRLPAPTAPDMNTRFRGSADETLGSVVKDRDDLDLVRESMSEVIK